MTAPLNLARIKSEAKSLLRTHPDGLRWAEMLRRIHEISPETPRNSIRGATFALFRDDKEIVKVSRGFYRLSEFETAERHAEAAVMAEEAVVLEVEQPGRQTVRLLEADFYEPFSEWLRDELNEVTAAVSLGGSLFRSKWGTPDVIGVLKPQASDLVKFEPKVVSAESKIDPNQPIVAFGQAISYRLFSHKSYIVVPGTMQDPDYDRLVALCAIYGTGLVTFDLNLDDPNFTLRVNAITSQPDMTYVNEMARQFADGARAKFNQLF